MADTPNETLSSKERKEPLAYQLKWIPWKDDFIPIVTQNQNGPCPLLALTNVLIFKGKLKIEAGQTFILSEELSDHLAEHLLINRPTNLSEAETANYEQIVQDALAIFPKLQTGIDVNVKFDSVSGFEFTSEIGLFDLLGVPLYHGWLADPKEIDTYRIVASTSYNHLVGMVIEGCREGTSEPDGPESQDVMLARVFLENTAQQLTSHGLAALQTTIEDNQFAILFRNNHFSMIHKHQGMLYELITDMGYLNEQGHIWQGLSDVHGNGDFFDAQFRLQTSERRKTELDHEVAVGLLAEEGEGLIDQPPKETTVADTPSAVQPSQPIIDELECKRLQEEEDRMFAYQVQQEFDREAESVPPPSAPQHHNPPAITNPPPQRSRSNDDCKIL